LLIGLLGRGERAVGRDVGLAYAANTLGAVLGALAGGFGILPALGAVGCWRAVALSLAAWSVCTALVAGARTRAFWRSGWVVGLAAAGVALASARGPTAAWRHSPIGAGRVPASTASNRTNIAGFIAQQRRTIDWQIDGIESAIGVGTLEGLHFIVNGKSDGNARGDAATQVMGGLLGAALLPRVERAMVIGLGTGSTAGWLAQLPELQRVEVAEIEPAIAHFARRCAAVNQNALDNPKLHMLRGDARELVLSSRERYDLIFSEPSNPYRAGVSSLYTREFYEAIVQRLAPGGLFVQWLQAYEIDAETMHTIFATLGSVFPHVEAWNGLHYDLLLVGSRETLVHDLARLRQRVASEPFATALRVAWNTDSAEGFLGHFVANAEFTRDLSASTSRRNTDDRALVEFGFARSQPDDHFAADSLFASARARNMHRPLLSDASVDWERVDFEREAAAQYAGAPTAAERLTLAYRTRLEMLRQWMAAEYAPALNTWNTLSAFAGQQQPIQLERLALAELIAYQGDQSTEPWIRTLTEGQPTLGSLLTGVWLLQHGQREAGFNALASAYEAYRLDPWPPVAMMARTLGLFRSENATVEEMTRWLEALSQPFAANINEMERQLVQARLAIALGPNHPACLAVLAQLEPEPPWSERLLEFRAACYSAHQHPLRAQAARDLERVREQQPVSFDRLLAPLRER